MLLVIVNLRVVKRLNEHYLLLMKQINQNEQNRLIKMMMMMMTSPFFLIVEVLNKIHLKIVIIQLFHHKEKLQHENQQLEN